MEKLLLKYGFYSKKALKSRFLRWLKNVKKVIDTRGTVLYNITCVTNDEEKK